MSQILLASDGSRASLQAAEWATILREKVPGTRITVLHVTNDHGVKQQQDISYILNSSNNTLEDDSALRLAAKIIGGDDPSVVRINKSSINPGEAICSEAVSIGAELIVVGSRAIDPLTKHEMGSVSEYVLHHSPCPVLIRRDQETIKPLQKSLHFLLAVDKCEASTHALEFITPIAQALSAQITLMYVTWVSPLVSRSTIPSEGLENPTMEQMGSIEGASQALLNPLRVLSEAGIEVSCTIKNQNNAHEAICKVAEQKKCDLIVMGRRRHAEGLASHRLGSVSQRVIDSAPTAVLAIY